MPEAKHYHILDFVHMFEKNRLKIDYDTDGLNFSKKIGFKAINLNSDEIKSRYDLITMTHVFEHIDFPLKLVNKLSKNLTTKGYLYLETPNMYATPLYDPTHLSLTNISALKTLLSHEGFEIIDFGFTQTPHQARNYGYIYSSEKEAIYLLIKKNKSNKKKYNYDAYPENAIRLIKNMNLSYFKIALNHLVKLRFYYFSKNLYHFFKLIYFSLLRLFLSKK